MPAAITLNAICTLALFVQLCIFLYFSDPNRVRFFRYLIWAWGFFVIVKGAELTSRLYPGVGGIMPFMQAAGNTRVLLVLAAGLAYRRAYRIRWHHACLGIALAIASALWETPAAEDIAAFPCRALVGGGLLLAGGLAFWPRRSLHTSHLGGRFLAISLALWGLHRLAIPFLPIPPRTGYATASAAPPCGASSRSTRSRTAWGDPGSYGLLRQDPLPEGRLVPEPWPVVDGGRWL